MKLQNAISPWLNKNQINRNLLLLFQFTFWISKNCNYLISPTKKPPGGGFKFGRPEANILEPAEFSLGRACKVQWKKVKPNLEELAHLYWIEKLTQQQIAKSFNIRRATIATAVKKYEGHYKNGNAQDTWAFLFNELLKSRVFRA